jgi:hypothetical protein
VVKEALFSHMAEPQKRPAPPAENPVHDALSHEVAMKRPAENGRTAKLASHLLGEHRAARP